MTDETNSAAEMHSAPEIKVAAPEEAPAAAAPTRKPAVALSEEEKAFMRDLHEAIGKGEYYVEIGGKNDLLRSIAQKNPDLLFDTLRDAKEESKGYGDQELKETDYNKYRHHIMRALKAVNYPFPPQKVKNKPINASEIALDEEKEFIEGLSNAIGEDQFFDELVTNNNTLRRIAQRNPRLLNSILQEMIIAEANDNLSEDNSARMKNYIKQALDEVNFSLPAKTSEHKASNGVSSYLKGVVTGVLMAIAGMGAGLGYLNSDREARSNASKWTQKAGFPLSPEDQAKAILANPEALEQLADHYGSKHGAKELQAALETDDAVRKTRALEELKDAMTKALDAVGDKQEKGARGAGGWDR